MIQNIPCIEGSFWTDGFGEKAFLEFYDNGNLTSCKLAIDTTLEGKKLESGSRVLLNREGKLIK